MWLLFTLVYCFLLALVNYIDEYLTNNSKVSQGSNIHTKIGGLLLISTLMNFVGAFVVWLNVGSLAIASWPLILVLLSSLALATTYASYFYLLTLYSPHLVVPLFQLSSIWLLMFELLSGKVISAQGLIGIFVLLAGAYFLDAGSIKWQIPSRLALIAIPVTSTFAISMYLVRVVSETVPISVITFWQMFGIGCVGVLLFLFVKKYRDGFLLRIKKQGKNFLGFSAINESLSESGFYFLNMAVAVAPIATYVSALSGVQGIFLLFLFLLFPQGERTGVSKLQFAAITLIACGVYLIRR
jgi:hypothetical protein